MEIFWFIILILVFCFALCTLVSVLQFFIDLAKNSPLRKELKATIKQIKQQNKINKLADAEEQEADNG